MPCRSPSTPIADAHLVQIVNQAVAEAARKSGEWLLCRPGCADCCIGVFPISQLDVLRLRQGMNELEASDPERAQQIRDRAQASIKRLSHNFPGDARTGILTEPLDGTWGDDEPCPALSPNTLTCDLYAHRPMTCRVFGPPLRTGDENAIGVCDLCYHGATSEQIAACEVVPDPDHLEEPLIADAETITGITGDTIVAYAVLNR